jgi:hypothetical protein
MNKRQGLIPPCSSHSLNNLSRSAPYTLQESISLSQPVERIVALAHGTNEAAKSKGVVLASVSAVLVDFSNADLDRSVVLGLDDAVGGGALAGDVPIQQD